MHEDDDYASGHGVTNFKFQCHSSISTIDFCCRGCMGTYNIYNDIINSVVTV